MMAKKLTIALAGNPNVGKSTLFNALTGSRQHVGNWPGKTVEKKEGTLKYKGYELNVVDLPGTYSLTAYSIEELVARDFVVDKCPDVVVHIVDATNLERNLYLAVQLIEMGANVIVALNMVDLARKAHITIDEKKIARFLGVPVVKIEANKKTGTDKLLDTAISLVGKKKKSLITYGVELEEHISKIEELIIKTITLPEKYNPKWIALKLLENDNEIINKIKTIKNSEIVTQEATKNRKHLQEVFGEDVDTSVADARYGFIGGLMREAVVKKEVNRLSASENIDNVVMHRALGIPIFFALMWVMFQVTFALGAPFADIIDIGFGLLAESTGAFIGSVDALPAWVGSLVVDGILSGIGSVLVFVPNIFLLFMMIAIMEASGYMARAAFIMDKVMHRIGLHGKSFIPMIIGFGCNVPAIMATRNLESEKDRILTMLINPFMSCSARLPVYVLFVGAFFSAHQGTIIFLIYLFGIFVALVSGMLFKKTMFRGLSSPLVMELPPYRKPALKG
ncbi:MAG: ferrous iron transport protein B, partial [Candidatus Aenigmarchaeota archaeon]|nr:ferrous iron transport protein B [Candidatus Aenigmarchaeota archaeon]